MPRLIVRASRGYIARTYYWFAPALLVRTLFAPWRRDVQETDGLSLVARLELWVENGMSRLFGGIIRLATLVIGGFILLIEVAFSSLTLIIWLSLLLVGVISLGLGTRYLLGGGL